MTYKYGLEADSVIDSLNKQIAELQEKLSKEVKERESLYPIIDEFKATIERYRKAELVYEDKLHRRNLQIADLKRELVPLIRYKNHICYEPKIQELNKQIADLKKAVNKYEDFILNKGLSVDFEMFNR